MIPFSCMVPMKTLAFVQCSQVHLPAATWGWGGGSAASSRAAGTCCAEVNTDICQQVSEVEFRVDKMPLSEGDLSNWARFISLGMNILCSADREKDIMRAPLATSTGSIEPVPRELLWILFVLDCFVIGVLLAVVCHVMFSHFRFMCITFGERVSARRSSLKG